MKHCNQSCKFSTSVYQISQRKFDYFKEEFVVSATISRRAYQPGGAVSLPNLRPISYFRESRGILTAPSSIWNTVSPSSEEFINVLWRLASCLSCCPPVHRVMYSCLNLHISIATWYTCNDSLYSPKCHSLGWVGLAPVTSNCRLNKIHWSILAPADYHWFSPEPINILFTS